MNNKRTEFKVRKIWRGNPFSQYEICEIQNGKKIYSSGAYSRAKAIENMNIIKMQYVIAEIRGG